MTAWAIIPVKPLRRGKSRLSSILSVEERQELNQCLLVHTLETLSSVPEIEKILVVSRDPEALALARENGALTVQENETPQLNMALTRATAVARNYTKGAVLILPADLPLLTTQDIRCVLQAGQEPPVVVIVPDRHNQGTNTLLINPPGIIEYRFGPGSFDAHCAQANKAKAKLKILKLPSLALDMDLPEDLDLVIQELDLLEET